MLDSIEKSPLATLALKNHLQMFDQIQTPRLLCTNARGNWLLEINSAAFETIRQISLIFARFT